MIKKLIREFQCDHKYCTAKARVETAIADYDTDYSKEVAILRNRKWDVFGFQQFCPKHKKENT